MKATMRNAKAMQSAKKGFDAELYDKKMIDHAKFFLDLSRRGLENRDILNSNNDDESTFLKDLDNFIINKKNLSNKLIDDFNKKYINNLDLIFDEKAF